MKFSVVDELYKIYTGDGTNRDTEKANNTFNQIIDVTDKVLSYDLKSEIFDLIGSYIVEVEERSFKDGLKYGVNLYKELQ